MQNWQADWRFFALIYIICAGFWGVAAKFAASRLDPPTVALVASTTATLVVVASTLSSLRLTTDIGIFAAVVAGFLGGISTLALYRALQKAPASIVLPLTSQYLLLTVILSYLLLGESMSLRQLAGIFLGILAIVLLTR